MRNSNMRSSNSLKLRFHSCTGSAIKLIKLILQKILQQLAPLYRKMQHAASGIVMHMQRLPYYTVTQCTAIA
jgi:hypothetical protein